MIKYFCDLCGGEADEKVGKKEGSSIVCDGVLFDNIEFRINLFLDNIDIVCWDCIADMFQRKIDKEKNKKGEGVK